MAATVFINPSAAFIGGIPVSQSDLLGVCADSACVAHYLLGSDTDGLKNRKNPGTFDLVPVGTTPVRSVGYATVSPASGYDTGISLPSQCTVLTCFGYNPAGQYVLGTGSGGTGQTSTIAIRTEVALVGGINQRRIRFSGAQVTDFPPAISRSYGKIWRFAGISIAPSGRTDFIPQWDGAPSGILYNTTSGTTAVAASPTLHIGAKSVYETGTYVAPSKVAEVIVLTRALSGAELMTNYLEMRRRMMNRLGYTALTGV